jgi:hypothetical protein
MRRGLVITVLIGSLLVPSTTAGASTQRQMVGAWASKVGPLIVRLAALDKKVGNDVSTNNKIDIASDAAKLVAFGFEFRSLEKAPLRALTLITARIANDVIKEGDDLKQYNFSHAVAPLAGVLKYENAFGADTKNLANFLKAYSILSS